jgi:hypothetical protein
MGPGVTWREWAESMARDEYKSVLAFELAAASIDFRAAEDALRELVELKDGPRDVEYERRKPLAWDRARAIVEGTTEEPKA